MFGGWLCLLTCSFQSFSLRKIWSQCSSVQASDFGTGGNPSLSPPLTLPLPQQWPEPPWLPLRTWTSLCGWPSVHLGAVCRRVPAAGSGYGRGGPWPGPRGAEAAGRPTPRAPAHPAPAAGGHCRGGRPGTLQPAMEPSHSPYPRPPPSLCQDSIWWTQWLRHQRPGFRVQPPGDQRDQEPRAQPGVRGRC